MLLMVACVKVLCRHHPTMRMLQQAWQHGGEDPWRLLHMLDEHGVPMGAEPDEDGIMPGPLRPEYPERQQALRFGFGQVAAENLAGGMQPAQQRPMQDGEMTFRG